jgi:hypothetical protein
MRRALASIWTAVDRLQHIARMSAAICGRDPDFASLIRAMLAAWDVEVADYHQGAMMSIKREDIDRRNVDF